MPSLSLEIFPDSNGDNAAALRAAVALPEDTRFVSITNTGGDFDRTARLCTQVQETGLVAAAHMLCGGHSLRAIDRMARDLDRRRVRKVVALRGDQQRESASGQAMVDTHEMVAVLAARASYDEIMVSGYPDVHPEAASAEADMAYLARKVAAGANRVITQFCFEPTTLLRYRDRMIKAGITVPVSAGLLPVRDYDKMVLFAARCQAFVPPSLHQLFADRDHSGRLVVARELLARLTAELLAEGFDIHYYTLNAGRMIAKVWAQVGTSSELRSNVITDSEPAS